MLLKLVGNLSVSDGQELYNAVYSAYKFFVTVL